MQLDIPPFYPVATDISERNEITEIIPQALYLTNWRGAADIQQLRLLGVTHVVAVGEEFLEDELPGITHWKNDITDEAEKASEMQGILEAASSFVHSALEGGGRVLVHCAAGASRSATVVLAYLMTHKEMNLLEGFGLLHRKRPASWPNEGFMAVLIALEASLRGASTISCDEYQRWTDWEGGEEEAEPSPEPLPPPSRPMLKRENTTLTLTERCEREQEIEGQKRLEALALDDDDALPQKPPMRRGLSRADLARQASEDSMAARLSRGKSSLSSADIQDAEVVDSLRFSVRSP